MGPVSFEALDAGDDRALALELAARLEGAGIRVMSVAPDGPHRFRLVVGSPDAARACDILGLGTVGPDEPSHRDDRAAGGPP